MKIYKRYLNAIKESAPLPLFVFKDWCSKQLDIDNELFSKIFNVTNSISTKHYLVSIKDTSLYEQYFSRFEYSSNDEKVEATLHGDSKKGKIDGGVLNFKHHYFDQHGISICFRNTKTGFNPSSTSLLLIENLNNFLSPNNVFVGIDEDKLTSNVIWSKGQEITSKQYVNFLNKYDQIICFFDFDLGGFEAFKRLKLTLRSDIKLTFYHPVNLAKYLNFFGKNVTDKQYLALRKYNNITELNDIINEIVSLKVNGRRSIRFLEQEALQIALESEINE
ncbi:DUF2220 family protein [Pseudoalteromonas sp. DY56-GL22]|uniref:Wadjet anti-phage system protein JetD domain-containing protein n=1 Tax=Pseudoalteromonas sp. DY56-GL22 TaxID=2967126 RepID=UPI00352BBB4A